MNRRNLLTGAVALAAVGTAGAGTTSGTEIQVIQTVPVVDQHFGLITKDRLLRTYRTPLVFPLGASVEERFSEPGRVVLFCWLVRPYGESVGYHRVIHANSTITDYRAKRDEALADLHRWATARQA